MLPEETGAVGARKREGGRRWTGTLPDDFWMWFVQIIGVSFWSLPCLSRLLCLNKSACAEARKLLRGQDLEQLKMKREMIYSQVVLFHFLCTDDSAFLKASLRVDQDTELNEQLVMARASTVPCNSQEFSGLFELCSHYRHRCLAIRHLHRGGIIFMGVNYDSFDLLRITQHLRDFRELFEFLKSDMETMKKTLEVNGLDPNVLIACEEDEDRYEEFDDAKHIFYMTVQFNEQFDITIRCQWDTFTWRSLWESVYLGPLSSKAYSIKTLFQDFQETLGSL